MFHIEAKDRQPTVQTIPKNLRYHVAPAQCEVVVPGFETLAKHPSSLAVIEMQQK
jgi:hypothetical protein